MDIKANIKKLYSILFPEVEDSSIDLDQTTYLTRLGTNGLDSLNGEVSRVNEELAIVEHQTRDMASQNYQIFVQSAQTTKQIKGYLIDGGKTVSKLTTEILPEVKNQISNFSSEPCTKYCSDKESLTGLFLKRDSMSTILEMPWIVRRCLAEERLPDAIKVLQMSQGFLKGVQNPPDILQKICSEVATLQSQIQQALLLKLSSGTIGLSECLQTVSLLRNFFSDDKSLRFRYLQSRMKEISFEEGRSWMFDTLTQHRAAFGGDSNHYLSTWVAIQVNRILADLEKRLEHSEAIDSFMMQANYFGESLARVGADIRGLVIPIFVDHLVRTLDRTLTESETKFGQNLKTFNVASAVASSAANPASANLDFPATDDLNPPHQLVTHPPLALYLNDLLTLLNLIGKCPLPQAAPRIVTRLESSVKNVGSQLESWGTSESLTWEMKEKSEFHRMKRYFTHLLVPHLDRVIRVIFPPLNLSEVTGIGVTQCAEMIQIKYALRELEGGIL